MFDSKIQRLIILVLLVFLCYSVSYSQNDKKFIRQGNGKYSNGKFPESEISYRKAIDANKLSADAVFNLGDALYKQNKFEEAGKQFLDNSQLSADNGKKADSYYNLGNSFLKANKPEESISAYKNSLRLNPDNPQAKYNLAYAQDLLKQQQEQQQQNKNDDQNKDDQKEDKKENKDQQGNNQQEQQKNNDQSQQQQPQISKEDAQRLLDALANDEKKVQEKVKEAKAAKARVRTVINW